MFIKSLIIRKNGPNGEIIRSITFHKGVNLILDTSGSNQRTETGNNIGKSTVLRLIDFCLGGAKDKIYQDPEFRGSTGNENANHIKQFLEESQVYIELTLTKSLDYKEATKISIGRNFLTRSTKIQTINGEQVSNDHFCKRLKELLLEDMLNKPSFRQVISKNIRHRDKALNHTVKILEGTPTNADYESIYLYWLGIPSNSKKIEITSKLNTEKTYREQIIKTQGDKLNTLVQKISLIQHDIHALNKQKAQFNLNENYAQDLEQLNHIKDQLNRLKTQIVSLQAKRSLIQESQDELEKTSPKIETEKVRFFYAEAKALLPELHKTFEDVLEFHLQMKQEKKKFIGQELPQIEVDLKAYESKQVQLLTEEKNLSEKLQKTGAIEELERLVEKLTKQHEQKGRLEKVKELLENAESKIKTWELQLNSINDELKKKNQEIERKITVFNQYFSEISYALYNQRFVLSHEFTTKNEQTNLKLLIRGLEENPGTGGKRGEIIAFDLAYIQFAEQFNIPHVNFILHDQIENIHDNQISTIMLDLVRKINCQYILPVLADKLPPEIDAKPYTLLTLSQQDKLFKLP